nr:hypothetical protein [Brucella intermedia]
MTTVPEEAKNAVAKALRESRWLVPAPAVELILTAALPHLPGVGVKADTLKLIERMAFGYEVMFEKLCHISGTSGADQSWYRSKAREATERLSPLHSITTESNKSVPGDCKRQYQDFMSRILSAIEPAPSPRALALEEIISELVDAQHKCFEWTGSAFLADELDATEDAECKVAIYKDLCALGNTMSWLQDQVRALSSPDHAQCCNGLSPQECADVPSRHCDGMRSGPDHADAGKVEGDEPIACVGEMQTSSGADYYVCVKVGGREITPHMFKERWKAEYEVAEWLWLFNGGEKPDLLAYGPLPSAPSQEAAGS